MAKKGKISQKSFLENVIGWGIILVFAVLPLLYFSGRTASYVTSKQYFLIGTVEVLLVLWTWLLLIDKRYRLTKQMIIILAPIALFLVALTVSAFVGVDAATSFFSTPETGTGLILLYHAFIFSCIVASFVRVQQRRFVKHVFQANLFASFILAILTFFTGSDGLFMTHSSMLNGSTGGATMGNSLLAGAYFIFSIFLTLYLIVHEPKTWKKIIYWLGIMVMILSPIYFNVAIWKGIKLASNYLFIGEARIATVSLVIGLFLSLFIWLCTRQQDKNKNAWRGIGAIGIAFMLISGVYTAHQIATPTASLHAFFVKESGNRVTDWQEAIQGIKAKPWLGWGPENYHVVYQRYLDPIVFSPGHGNEVWALHPHNNTLEVLVNGGIIGFVAYLLVLIALFGGLINLYRKDRIDGKTFALFIGMFIALIIQQQMIYDSITSYTMFFALLGIIAGLSDTTDEQREVIVYKNTTTYVMGTLVTVLMIPLWVYAAYLPARKMEELQTIASVPSDQRTAQYDHLFHSAGSYALDTDAEFFTDPLFFSYDPQRETLKSNPTYQKISSQEIATLLQTVNPVWQQHPYDYHLTLSLINLENLEFYLSGNPQSLIQAEAYFVHGVALSPTDPQIYVAHANTLILAGDKKGAVVEGRKALALSPDYNPAQKIVLEFK